MVVLILIDAFRWDYPERTSFIKELAQKGVTGNFIEPFGFIPRDAYFGGLTPEESGFTHMFCKDPEKSPFISSYGMQELGEEVYAKHDHQLRSEILKYAKDHTTPFGRLYLQTLQIPIPILDQFNLSEPYSPWDKKKNYTSIFDLLDKENKKWFQCSWPFTNEINPNDDKSLTKHCIQNIKAEHEFAYIHLMELDSNGHQYGPESRQIKEKIDNTDQYIRALYKHCQKVSDNNLTFILFGDHGMVTITKQIDIWSKLQESGLKLKHDYLCFLDSTMARFWFNHQEAKDKIVKILNEFKEGHILTEEELIQYKIKNCDPKNAELIFMAHPGVVIQPNFFDFNEKTSIKGMHGYAPESFDNRGALIYHKSDNSVQGQFEKDFQSWDLFPLLIKELHLDYSSRKILPAITLKKSDQQKALSVYPEADPIVRTQLSTAAKEILKEVPDAKCIFVSGGFGRGEGTIEKTAHGFTAINDYDFGIISDLPTPSSIKDLGRRLAKDFNIDYVDLAVIPPFSEYWTRTQYNFDLKHGSQVILGDEKEFNHLPYYYGNEIFQYEAFKLIFNRFAGFLTTHLDFKDGKISVPRDKEKYFLFQFIKMMIALGDALLMSWGAYDVSYLKKADRLRELLQGFPEFSEQEKELIFNAYQQKVYYKSVDFKYAYDHIQYLPLLIEKTLKLITSKALDLPLDQISIKNIFELIENSYQETTSSFDKENSEISKAIQSPSSTSHSLMQKLYQVISLLVLTSFSKDSERERYWNLLNEPLKSLGTSTLKPEFNEEECLLLQKKHIELWEQFCH